MQLNPNLKERRMGYFFMFIFFLIALFYLFFDGWIYEWMEYGYAGANQHWDLKIFGDMVYTIVDGEFVYTSTHNLQHFLYLCFWTAGISYWYLITGNKWLRQGAIATMAFPVMALLSSINPVNITEWTSDIFRFHSYLLQMIFDVNHISGTIMGVYIFRNAVKEGLEDKEGFGINLKMMTPFILGTWVIYLISKAVMIPPGSDLAYYDINQLNQQPFYFFGLEFIVAVGLLYGMNVGVKFLIRKLPNPKAKTIVPFVIFAVMSLVLVLSGLVPLQNIPAEAFIQL